MAACFATDNLNGKGLVTIIEKNNRVARKVMITGKGRCNLTNNCSIDELIKNTNHNGKFLYSAFNFFSSADVINFFENAGVPLKTERGNRVFPKSDKAVSIVDALHNSVKKRGVKIIEGTVKEIISENSRVSKVILEDNRTFDADAVIIATGGLSYPLTGSTGDGYKMATELGHTVTALSPSLVPLDCHEGFCSRLAGLTLKNTTLSVFEEGKKKAVFSELGELLFTHFGISGPLVLSASAHLKEPESRKYKAFIDLKPALNTEQLDKRVLRDFEENINKDFRNALDGLLPKSLIPVIISLSGIEGDTKVNSIRSQERQALVRLLKAFPLTITGFRPIEEAVITRGGISVKEINPSTMASKVIDGLFFAGEVIDVDAYTGGFNLQIAFSSGALAGSSAANYIKGELL